MRIIKLDSVDSTNDYCKRLDTDGDVIVIAEKQTGGRGTKGRSFCSENGGIYLTVMRRYTDFPAKNAFEIMVNSCVAVCRTLEELGLSPSVRWANDVLVGGRKICGTLIENSFSGGYITRSVVGMGINVNNELPEELKDIATSVKEQTGREHNIEKVTQIFVNNLQKSYKLEEYKKYIDFFGREVDIIEATGKKRVTALDVDEGGNLVVSDGGTVRKISAAEVSLRL